MPHPMASDLGPFMRSFEMHLSKLYMVLGCAVALFLTVMFRWRRLPKGFRYPPGPRGLPLIGPVTSMPSPHDWKAFSRWAGKYGDFVYIPVIGKSIIFVNSIEIANDLFEKRSSLYSDRCDFPMLMLMGFGWNLGLMRYGANWRIHRKLFAQHFHPSVMKSFYSVQSKWARRLLLRLLECPDDFVDHLRYQFGGVIMEMAYGIQVLPKHDPYIEAAEEAMALGGAAANPGTFLVDLLPFLRHVPEWVPGAGFKKNARLWRVIVRKMIELPFGTAQKEINAGIAPPSILASLLAEMSQNNAGLTKDDEDVIRNVTGVAYAAGGDSSGHAVAWFILAMVLHPEVQRKAQAELDAVVGMDRLPGFEDQEHLPYIDAICKEVLRWNPVAPLGIAHALVEDDLYKGYFIPKGSIVVGNSRGMLHDERSFGPRPEEFRPERFLEPGVSDPSIAFGYGRRICPGRYMAMNTIFISVACILKVFNISHAKDGEGNEIPVKASSTLGAITHPEPFRCSITPRSAATASFLSELCQE